MEDRSQRIKVVSHGMKHLTRRVQGRDFITTSFRKPTSQHSPLVSKSLLPSSSLEIDEDSAVKGPGLKPVPDFCATEEVLTTTTDWVIILFWITQFSAAWQEQLVPVTCWTTE